MLKSLKLVDFKGVPHLPGTKLMQIHGGKLKFSTSKPNVIVGPNGAGKTALLTALSLRFLTHFTGVSALDRHYMFDSDAKDWWSTSGGWRSDHVFLRGLECVTDEGPALFYRPGHCPGNEVGVVHAMMTGYDQEARAYGRAIEKKSSGQGNQALLSRLMKALDGSDLPSSYGTSGGWTYGYEPIDVRAQRHHVADYDYQAEALKAQIAKRTPESVPLIMMDEPEQSLDARAEAVLWNAIGNADCTKMQIIVATHSVHPLMHPKRFNLIEAEAGFSAEVQLLLN